MVNSFKALTLALFLCLGGTAQAGYAQAIPPSNWSSGSYNLFKGVATNEARYAAGKISTSAVINVGGRAVTMPATMRFAANAPRIAAGLMFVNPGLAAGVRAAGWLATAALVYNASTGLWEKKDSNFDYPISDGFFYSIFLGGTYLESRSKSEMCELVGSVYVSNSGYYALVSALYTGESAFQIVCEVKYRVGAILPDVSTSKMYPSKTSDSSCPVGWYVTPAGCSQTPSPKTVENEQEFLDRLTNHPMPDDLPLEIPHHFPVELPQIDPVFVPTGNPRPNPVYDPSAEPSPENQPWIQPGTKIQPAPTPRSPWQVDLQPVNRPTSSPDPKPDISIEPKPDNGNPPTNPPGETPVTPGLCDQYPDILACAKLEEPEEEKLPEVKISEEFQFMDGFYSSATCPVFPQIDMLPGLSWQPFCDQLARIRPLVLAFAWLSAVMIILKYGRK